MGRDKAEGKEARQEGKKEEGKEASKEGRKERREERTMEGNQKSHEQYVDLVKPPDLGEHLQNRYNRE